MQVAVQTLKRFSLGAVMAIIIMLTQFSPVAHAASANFKEEEIRFQSGDVTLDGTILIPDGPGPHPAIVLVHGSSSGKRERYRKEAEVFAKAGIAALIYDKRVDGFAKSRFGGRSYSLLADDVLAAVGALGSRPDIAPGNIGLWGISEGGRVASLAASRSSEVSFLITVGSSGVRSAQQQSWHLENRLRHQGVTSESMIRFAAYNGIRFAVSAGLFPEAAYDPVPVYQRVRQPVLAIWGSNDRIEPMAESAQIMQEAFIRGGNRHYTIQFVANASHLLRSSTDGFTQLDAFAPGYTEAMISWVRSVVQGELPGPAIVGQIPQQRNTSPAGITDLAWYDSAWLQLGTTIVLLLLFAGYLVTSLIRSYRHRHTQPEKLKARWTFHFLAGTGFVTLLGFIAYFGFLMSTGAKNVAPVMIGRPMPWLLLQLLTVATCSLTVWAAATWRSLVTGPERVRFFFLLVGGLLFIPWALYWQLLSL